MKLLIVVLVFLALLMVRFAPVDCLPLDREGLPLPTCDVSQFTR